jgi:hypothetical protein
MSCNIDDQRQALVDPTATTPVWENVTIKVLHGKFYYFQWAAGTTKYSLCQDINSSIMLSQ